MPTNLASPIILDLNGDGVQTLGINATDGRFDLLNTGTAVRSGWISQGDAFLAIDSNGNGSIDDRNELFGGEVGEGFAKLASFDSNGDGQVDQNDARFNLKTVVTPLHSHDFPGTDAPSVARCLRERV